MKDIVWIKLNALESKNPYDASTPEGEQFVMFGPGGITRFYPLMPSGTVLIGQRDSIYVQESPQYIMTLLQKVRNTEGVLDGGEEQDEETESSSSTSNEQAESSL